MGLNDKRDRIDRQKKIVSSAFYKCKAAAWCSMFGLVQAAPPL